MKKFEETWKEFMKNKFTNRTPEDLDRYELARLFYEFGYGVGVLDE